MLRIGSAAFAKKLRQAREPAAGTSLVSLVYLVCLVCPWSLGPWSLGSNLYEVRPWGQPCNIAIY